MASRILTITLNKENIKISEVEKNSASTVRVYTAITINTPEDSVDEEGLITDLDLVSNAIMSATSANGMNSTEVIFSIQSSKIISKEVMTPVLKDAKLKEFIKTNASEYFPVNIDEYLVSHYILETIKTETSKDLKVMVVAVPSALVQQYYELALALGLNVISMDYANNSNSRLLGWQVDDRGTVVIQMGEESTTVCIFHNKVPQLIRTVPYGRSTVAGAVMDKRNVTYDDAIWLMTTKPIIRSSFGEGDYITDSLKYLVNNIGRVIDYYISKNTDVPVETAVFISEEKPIMGVETLLQEELNIPVEKIDTLHNVTLEYNLSVAINDLTKYITNIGAVINPVNFITQEVEMVQQKSNSGRRTRLAFIIGIGVAALFIVVPLVMLIISTTMRSVLQKEIAKIDNIRVVVNDYYDAKDKNAEISAFSLAASGNNDYLGDLIVFLEEEMPSDISISSMNIANGDVTLSCTGNSKDTLASFIDILNKQPNISNVYVASFSESEDFSGAITVSYSLVFSFTEFVEAEPDVTEEPVPSEEPADNN
ncbi:MAG: pilus assembly protein PilM [Butyrivibrio sp.]